MDVPAPPAAGAAAPTDGWSEPGAEVRWSAAPRGARAPHRLPRERSATWAGSLGWLVPGGGQFFLGRWGAGLLLLLVIGGTFAGGLALTDFTCVDPRTYQLEFVAQVLIGGPTALVILLTRDAHLERMPPWIEVGRLYVVVAGFLNLVAICDALGECWRRNARLQALRARLAVRSARPAWDEAPLPALAGAVPATEPHAVPPVDPVDPVGPADPVERVDPVGPVEPVHPIPLPPAPPPAAADTATASTP